MTYSWEIEDFEELQSIVKRELKSLGIRISKKKDGSKTAHLQDSHASPLFGKALHTYPLARDDVSNCQVPSFLVECTKFLDNHLNLEGIFRISGSKSRQRELQRNLENGSCIPPDANPADVSSLFKQFFRNLPEPVLSHRLQSAFLKSPQFEDPAEQRWVVLNICYLLPPLNLQMLRFVTHFLHRVAAHSENNRMDASNLAKVFTPNLMGAFSPSDKKNPDKIIGLQTAVVQLMIENAKLIGEVPDWITEKVNSAGQDRSRDNLDRLTSEDELEKSDDNLEDTFRPMRRRRRKSGGSFQVLVSGLGHSLGILKTGTSTENILSDVTQSAESPKIMKRKAGEDIGSAFSSVKRKAMLHKMTSDPLYSKPGLHLHRNQPLGPTGTPMTPLQHNKPPLGEADALTAEGETLFRCGTPSIVYADDSFAGHTPSRLAGIDMSACKDERFPNTPKSKLKRFKEMSAKKLKRRSIVLNFDDTSTPTRSPRGSKTPTTKRKDGKDVGWRLANASPPEGKLDTLKIFDQPVRPTPDFSSPGRKRKHFKAPSSPARLLTGTSPAVRRSQRLHHASDASLVTPTRKMSLSDGESPKVFIVDTGTSERPESPKVMVVDTTRSSCQNLTNEYVKNQEVHTSQLLGSKLGSDHSNSSVQIPDTTRQKIRDAEVVFATMASEEPKQHVQDPSTGKSSSGKCMAASVSQVSLSSVLSGISTCSHKSEFSRVGVENVAAEDKPKTVYMETEICSPCIVDCKDNTVVTVDDLPETNIVSEMKDAYVDTSPVIVGDILEKREEDDKSEGCQEEEDSVPDDMKDGNVNTSPVILEDILEKKFDVISVGCQDLLKSPLQDRMINGAEHDIVNPVEETIMHSQPDDRVFNLQKSDSLDSGKGCSMEDLCDVDGGKESKLEDKHGVVRQVSMDAGLGDGCNEVEGEEKEDDKSASKVPEGVEAEEVVSLAEQYSTGEEIMDMDDSDTNKCDLKDDTAMMDNDVTSTSKDDTTLKNIEFKLDAARHQKKEPIIKKEDNSVFKVPKCIDPTISDADMQSIINSALKSDMKKSLRSRSHTLPLQDPSSTSKKSGIVKANIQLFNSFCATQQDASTLQTGNPEKTRIRRESQRETRSHSKPVTPLTKSRSMDSFISEVQAETKISRRQRDFNNSYLMAVEGRKSKKKALSTSASMENVSTPTKDRKSSYDKALEAESRGTMRGAQSLENVSTPQSVSARKGRVKNAKPMQNESEPKNVADITSPSSFKNPTKPEPLHPIRESQSMLNICTPTSKTISPRQRPVRNASSMQNVSTPRNMGGTTSPSSIRRRRPVSQSQKNAFIESESFIRLRQQKAFDVEDEDVVPSIKPLGDNNSPRLRRTRRPMPIDPRLATPLTPVNLPQRSRGHTPRGRRASPGNLRSPVKPIKRLGKSPSPGRAIYKSTPDGENRTPKRYPRSPKNPLQASSPKGRRPRRSAVPVHVQDQWEL